MFVMATVSCVQRKLLFTAFFGFIVCTHGKKALFELVASNAKCKGSILKTVHASSLVHCMSRCNADSKCSMANLNEELETCELLANSGSRSVETESAPGWTCHRIPNIPATVKADLTDDSCPATRNSEEDTPCSLLGKSKCSPAKSCLQISLSCSSDGLTSGLYWIIGPVDAIQMFCDMETDRGGWTRVAIFNTTSGTIPNPPTYASADLSSLHRANGSFFMLLTGGLEELRSLINFTQIRIFCFKPKVTRTFHIATMKSALGTAVVDYMTGRTNTRPAACSSFIVFPDDTSKLSQQCDQWPNKKWGSTSLLITIRLYYFPAYVNNAYHIAAGNDDNRYECDDFTGLSDKKGVWVFFVR